MIEAVLFEEPNTRSRFLAAPCLREREQYLCHLMRRGYGLGYLQTPYCPSARPEFFHFYEDSRCLRKP